MDKILDYRPHFEIFKKYHNIQISKHLKGPLEKNVNAILTDPRKKSKNLHDFKIRIQLNNHNIL